MLLKPNIFTRAYRKKRANSGICGVILGLYPGSRPKRLPIFPKKAIRNRYRMVKYRGQHDFCEICDVNKATCTHHEIHFVDGGSEDAENYLALCTICHSKSQ